MIEKTKRKVRQNGGACIFTIPFLMCVNLDILPGTELIVEQDEEKITLTPIKEVEIKKE